MKQNAKRDFLSEAAADVERLVISHPDQTRAQLFDLAMAESEAVSFWVNEETAAALQRSFGRLLRYATAELPDGRKVRLLQTYRKFVQTEDGKEVQLNLWKHLDSMTRDEAADAVRGLDANISGAIVSRNAVVAYWNERHPDENPLPPLKANLLTP